MYKITRPFYVLEDLHLLGSLPTDFHFLPAIQVQPLPWRNRNANVYACKVWVTAIVASALIALSRLYNAAHYPTDVILCGDADRYNNRCNRFSAIRSYQKKCNEGE